MRLLFLWIGLMINLSLCGQQRSSELLQFAINNVNERHFEVAEQALNKLLISDPTHRDALFLRGYCLYKMERYDGALNDMNHLIELDPAYVNAFLIRARLHRANGNFWSSVTDYNRARKLDPYQTFFSITRGMLSETK